MSHNQFDFFTSWKSFADMKILADALMFYKENVISHLPNRGIYVYDERWDSLIILDACRFDAFKEMSEIKGDLESRISRGSNTSEFLFENFLRHPKYATFKDVVYVAANPFVSWLLRDRFHEIYPVWDYGWDDNLQTVPPDVVVREALKARERHPDKRLIVHFVQPHFPSLVGRFDSKDLTIYRKTALEGVNWSSFIHAKGGHLKRVDWSAFRKQGALPSELEGASPTDLLARGKLDKDEVYSAYLENLKIVLLHADNLAKLLNETTVISSDHGELFGERPSLLFPIKTYGHKLGLRFGALIRVPWLVVTRNNIETDQPNSI